MILALWTCGAIQYETHLLLFEKTTGLYSLCEMVYNNLKVLDHVG